MKQLFRNLKLVNTLFVLTIIAILLFIDCGRQNTSVSIIGKNWYINDKIVNKGSPAEGLLLNVRMVNAVFEDVGEEINQYTTSFDPNANTDNFILKIPEYAINGINAFTINLQGGLPGYEGAVNTAYNPDGSLRLSYLKRVKNIIENCNNNNTVVILSCFYQRQHSNKLALNSKKSIKIALSNIVTWVDEMGFKNVILEISNEYRHGGYKNWTDGDWIIKDEGQLELIELAKSKSQNLLISTSAMGDGIYSEVLADKVDFITIHFNTTSLNDYTNKIQILQKFNKPIICNEDNKLGDLGATAMTISVKNGCAWGYMNINQNQSIPFNFEGIKDDKIVYKRFKELSTKGFNIDQSMLEESTSIVITNPTDGKIFNVNENINVKLAHHMPENSTPISIELISNNKKIFKLVKRDGAVIKFTKPGNYQIYAVVRKHGKNELYRSQKVEIIIKN